MFFSSADRWHITMENTIYRIVLYEMTQKIFIFTLNVFKNSA